MTNVKHIGISLAAVMALGIQAFAQAAPSTQVNDSTRTGDFLGTSSMDLRVNDCGVTVPAADLAAPTTAYQISTEYLMRKDYNATIDNAIFTLGIANPATVSDATIEIKFPTLVDTTAIVGMNIIDIDPNLDGDFSDATTILTHSNSLAGNVETFDSATSTDIVNGHRYCISDGTEATETDAGCLALDIGIAQGTYADGTEFTGNIEWNVYSNSGTAERRDYGAMPLYYVVKDQYSIVCRSDFDALINWENGRKSFVANKHDVDATNPTDVQDTVKDSLIFTITNLAGRTGVQNEGSENPCGAHTFDTWLEGNETEFDITSTGALTAANIPNAQRTLVSSTAGVADGSGAWITDFLTTFTTADEPIPFGETEYTITYDNSEGYVNSAVIPASTFTGNVDLEADDNGTTYLNPQVSMPTDRSVGEWKDHAFIAQIAGGSVTKYDDDTTGMQTKLFIVNRSCTTATPVINLVMGGDLIPLTGLDPIEPNQQGFIDIGKVLHDMGKDVSGYDYAKFGFEVTLAGEAEDFYMYAQVKNIAIDQFKDLPVYTTSNRN